MENPMWKLIRGELSALEPSAILCTHAFEHKMSRKELRYQSAKSFRIIVCELQSRNSTYWYSKLRETEHNHFSVSYHFAAPATRGKDSGTGQKKSTPKYRVPELSPQDTWQTALVSPCAWRPTIFCIALPKNVAGRFSVSCLSWYETPRSGRQDPLQRSRPHMHNIAASASHVTAWLLGLAQMWRPPVLMMVLATTRDPRPSALRHKATASDRKKNVM